MTDGGMTLDEALARQAAARADHNRATLAHCARAAGLELPAGVAFEGACVPVAVALRAMEAAAEAAFKTGEDFGRILGADDAAV